MKGVIRIYLNLLLEDGLTQEGEEMILIDSNLLGNSPKILDAKEKRINKMIEKSTLILFFLSPPLWLYGYTVK